MKKEIMDIPIPNKIKNQLIELGIDESEIDNETALAVSLYQQALKGNVSAIDKVQKMIKAPEQEEEKVKDITKEVEKEEKRIFKMLDKLPDEQKEANKDFVHQIAFQNITLKYLADDIAKNGVKEKYCNGANQWGYKDRTEVKTYNNMFKNYQSAIKQLNELILENGISMNDGFEDF